MDGVVLSGFFRGDAIFLGGLVEKREKRRKKELSEDEKRASVGLGWGFYSVRVMIGRVDASGPM